MTLTELLVAMGLTVMMLAATAMVFTSSTNAAGKARAHNEIMQQLRAVTAQLERDFAGLRPDMPMAAIFDNFSGLRRDRIVFFANGDFQTNLPPGWAQPTLSSNLARIYYGQSFDSYDSPQMEENDTPRWILTRREKLLTSDVSLFAADPLGSFWTGWTNEVFDAAPYEHATVSFWKNVPTSEYEDYYFLTNPALNNSRGSMMRAINMANITDFDALQRLYVLPDVSNLQIQFWFSQLGRWVPEELDFAVRFLDPSVFASSPNVEAFAFYWNVADIDGSLGTPLQLADDSIRTGAIIDWWSQEDLAAGGPALTNNWPTAIKFTFTLYDGGRRYFPEGRTFNYIIKLPEKK